MTVQEIHDKVTSLESYVTGLDAKSISDIEQAAITLLHNRLVSLLDKLIPIKQAITAATETSNG